MKFQDKLILLRKQKGISQEELAGVIGVSRQTVYKWEAGTNRPDTAKLKMLTEFFNVSFDYLLDDKKGTEAEDAAQNEAQGSQRSGKAKYRSSFCIMGVAPIDPFSPFYEHGYACFDDRLAKRVKDSQQIFYRKRKELHAFMESIGATNLIFPRGDLCLCYFEDEKNKTFGFYFDGAIQFLCPFENYIDVEFDGDTATFLYFDKEGKACNYKIYFEVWADGKFPNADVLAVSGRPIDDFGATVCYLGDIKTRLRAAKEIGALIKAGEIAVKEINTDELQAAFKRAFEKNSKEQDAMKLAYKAYMKKKKIIKWSIIGAVVLAIVAAMAIPI